MASDIDKLLEIYKLQIAGDRKRLNVELTKDDEKKTCDNDEHQRNNNVQSSEADKENQSLNNISVFTSQNQVKIEDLKYVGSDGSVERKTFHEKPDEKAAGNTSDRNMLRYGEYSPNNPQLRVTAAPYLGLGEYDQRRSLIQQRRRADYFQHLPSIQYDEEVNPYLSSPSTGMQGNRNLSPFRNHHIPKSEMDKPKSILSNRRTNSPRERFITDFKSSSSSSSYTPTFMDGFSYQDRTEDLERERLKRENYQRELRLQIEDKRRIQSMREEQERIEQELENKRLEQQLLRMQEQQMIEEQRRCRRDEQMRRHSEDLLRRKHELQCRLRKHTESESSVASLRNTNVASTNARISQSHYSPPVSRRHNPSYTFNVPSTSVFAAVDSSPSSSSAINNIRYNNSSTSYSLRKDALNRMDSLNAYDNNIHRRFNAFSRYDSLSRIDSLNRHKEAASVASGSFLTTNNSSRFDSYGYHQPDSSNSSNLGGIQRRHSATQQDLTSFIRKSPKLQRRSSSSRFDDTLPIPVLMAHSPVAKELKNSVPFNSNRSDALRRLEDKWQIPAVQKNIVTRAGELEDYHIKDGHGRNILTQLGAIRMQLQREQLRMDEILRKRDADFTQSEAVDFHS